MKPQMPARASLGVRELRVRQLSGLTVPFPCIVYVDRHIRQSAEDEAVLTGNDCVPYP